MWRMLAEGCIAGLHGGAESCVEGYCGGTQCRVEGVLRVAWRGGMGGAEGHLRTAGGGMGLLRVVWRDAVGDAEDPMEG